MQIEKLISFQENTFTFKNINVYFQDINKPLNNYIFNKYIFILRIDS